MDNFTRYGSLIQEVLSVLQRFAYMGRFDCLRGVEVGYSAGNFDRFEIPSGAQIELLGCDGEKLARFRGERSVFFNITVRDITVVFSATFISVILPFFRFKYRRASRIMLFIYLRFRCEQHFMWYARDRNEHVDPIKERPRQPFLILNNLHAAASTFVSRIAVVAARAGVHSGYQHKICWERDVAVRAANCYIFVLEWLTKRLKAGARILGEFIQKKDTEVG